MSCLTLTPRPIPPFPAGITIPAIGIDPSLAIPAIDLCCKLPPVNVPHDPISIPATILNPSVIATLNTAIRTLQSYLHKLPLKCPLE